jgi:hypothetical protein
VTTEHQPTGGRGQRALVTLGLAVVILVALGWATSGVGHYATAGGIATGADGIVVPRDDGRRWHVVRFEPGREVVVAVGLAHHGPLAVRLVDAQRVGRQAPHPSWCGWWPEAVRVGGVDGVHDLDDGVILRPGDEIVLTLTGRFVGEPGCLPDGAKVSWQRVSVGLRVLGLPKRSQVQLDEVLTWASDPRAVADHFAATSVTPRANTAP